MSSRHVPTTKTRVFNVIEGNYTNRQLIEAIRKVKPDAKITLCTPEQGTSKGYVVPRMDASGVKAELGWQPKYSLEDGLRKSLNYFRRKAGMQLL